jgi:hypothetical protein
MGGDLPAGDSLWIAPQAAANLDLALLAPTPAASSTSTTRGTASALIAP